MSDKVDRDCICWSINDGMNSTWLYPEDMNYIEDGLKCLKTHYNDLAQRLYASGMVNSHNRIKLRVENINSLIKLIGGDPDDYTLRDTQL